MSETINDPAAEPSGDPMDDAPVNIADKPREPTAYERRLRAEARQHRLRALQAEKDRDAALERARQEAKALVDAARAEGLERLLRAEIKAHALAAGIVDLKALKLLDLSSIKLGSDGEVEIPTGFFDKAKLEMPYLFKVAPVVEPTSPAVEPVVRPNSTSVPAVPPTPSQPTTEKLAKDMTPAELQALELTLFGQNRPVLRLPR
jgi:hypothetical protein